jgi:hypothetical protein
VGHGPQRQPIRTKSACAANEALPAIEPNVSRCLPTLSCEGRGQQWKCGEEEHPARVGRDVLEFGIIVLPFLFLLTTVCLFVILKKFRPGMDQKIELPM